MARDGDRDGLPNVLIEAQSQGLACVATRVSAIPELMRDGKTGVLVRGEAPGALARALKALIPSPARRRALGRAGQARVLRNFGLDANVERARAQVRAAPAGCESPSTHRLSRRRTACLRATGASPAC